MMAEFTCKYCGRPSHLDPVDQTPPVDYCHESDHGEPTEHCDAASVVKDFAAEVKQLCKDFSDLRDRPYMGDVISAIDGLVERFLGSR